jgi:hypothetical protein
MEWTKVVIRTNAWYWYWEEGRPAPEAIYVGPLDKWRLTTPDYGWYWGPIPPPEVPPPGY